MAAYSLQKGSNDVRPMSIRSFRLRYYVAPYATKSHPILLKYINCHSYLANLFRLRYSLPHMLPNQIIQYCENTLIWIVNVYHFFKIWYYIGKSMIRIMSLTFLSMQTELVCNLTTFMCTRSSAINQSNDLRYYMHAQPTLQVKSFYLRQNSKLSWDTCNSMSQENLSQ